MRLFLRHWKRWGGISLRQDLYTAVINDKLDLANKDVLNQWLKRHNIDSIQYLKTSESQAVQERLKICLKLANFIKLLEHLPLLSINAMLFTKTVILQTLLPICLSY